MQFKCYLQSYHCFFKNLRVDLELVDRLPEPDQLQANELVDEEGQRLLIVNFFFFFLLYVLLILSAR